MLLLKFLVDPERYRLESREFAAADVSGNFNLTPYDAFLMYNQAELGCSSPLASCAFPSVDDDQDGSGPDISFFQRDNEQSYQGPVYKIEPTISPQTIGLSLDLNTVEPIQSVFLELSVQAEDFRFLDFESNVMSVSTDNPSEAVVEWSFDDVSNRLKIALFFKEATSLKSLGSISYSAQSTPQLDVLSGYFDENMVGLEMGETTITSIEDELGLVKTDFDLYQNYPNPFNPVTQISFEIPNTSRVRIEVFNMLGQRVSVVTDQVYTSGKHVVDFNASFLPSGIYTYILQAEGVQLRRNMTLLK
jgi:hypothetical protein